MKRRWFMVVLLALALVVQPVRCDEVSEFVIYLPMVERAMSNWKVVVPEATTNKALNPSAGTTGNFAAAGGATVSRVTTYGRYGLYSYRVQSAGDNQGMTLTLSVLANAIHYVTLRVRGTLPAA